MNDAFYEQLVTRKTKPMDIILRILIIVFIAAVAVLGTPFIGFLAFFIAVVLAMLVYYFVFPRFNVEYEYTLLNYDIDVAAIFSKEKRKNITSFDIRQAEIIAPVGSPRLNSYHPGKTHDFSSGSGNAKVYAIMIPLESNTTCFLLELDETMKEHMKSWTGMKFYED